MTTENKDMSLYEKVGEYVLGLFTPDAKSDTAVAETPEQHSVSNVEQNSDVVVKDERPRDDAGRFVAKDDLNDSVKAAVTAAMEDRMPKSPAPTGGRPYNMDTQVERVREYNSFADMPDDITYEEIEKLVQNGWMPDLQKVPEIGFVSKDTLKTYKNYETLAKAVGG